MLIERTKAWEREKAVFDKLAFVKRESELYSSLSGARPGDEDMQHQGVIQLRDNNQEIAKDIKSCAGILTVYAYVECELEHLERAKGNLELCRGAILYVPNLVYTGFLLVDFRAILIAPKLRTVNCFNLVRGGRVIAPNLPKSQRRR